MSVLPKRGVGVSPSPLNGVKLELGVILCLAVVAWLVAGHLSVSPEIQVLLLGIYGIAGMTWLIGRARRVLRQAAQDGEDGHGKDELQSPVVD
jgi:Flp pilus assembly protein TadB